MSSPRTATHSASKRKPPAFGQIGLPPPPIRDHAKIAHQYALDVVAKKVPGGPWVRKAAQRHLDDLAKVKEVIGYPYRFDADRGARVCRFVELLPHVKGQWAARAEKLVLSPWQCFILCCIFGWLRAKDGRRRFRSVYLEIPRKNGKSILAAGIGLYMLLADNEFGAEVYSGATTEKQAWEVFGPARLMLKNTPDLAERLGAEVWAKQLSVIDKNSKFQPIIGNPGDGASPSCAIVDEYHEHDTPNLHDTMETGMGAREQPLMLIITTAGYNVAGPCHEKHDELRKVLEKSLVNESMFGIIFGIDEADDWADPKVLLKANPNFGVSVDGEFLESQQRAAMANPVQQTKFKTKHLNMWCSVLTGWMNMQMWTMAADPMLDEDELAGCDCVFAIDLASKSDLCSEQRLYWKTLPGNAKPHFYLFGTYWLPEAAIEEQGPNRAHYQKWVRTGLLTPTDGATVDFDLITETILDDAKKRRPREIVYDPYNATQMAQALVTEKMQTVEFTQNASNFALPMDEIVAALKDGRFHHDGNEMTTWCFSNVVARPAKKGLFAPSKSKPHQKIDGAIAAIMAMSRSVAIAEPEYEMLFV
jgi:phage terminase large subunit-like protein